MNAALLGRAMRRVGRLPVRVVGRAARAGRVRRHRGASSASLGTETAPGAQARRRVLVSLYDAGMALCAAAGCGRMAELLVLVSPPASGQWLWPWCVEHWESVRQVFIRPGDRIEHGPGATERINDRTRHRLKAELAQLHPVKHPAAYNRVFSELVALEQQRRRQQGHGHGPGPEEGQEEG